MNLLRRFTHWLNPQRAHDSARISAAIQELGIIRAMALDDLAAQPKPKIKKERWLH